MQTVTPRIIIHALTKRIKQTLLSLHLHGCVCVWYSLSQQVCAGSFRVHRDVYLQVPQKDMPDRLVGKWDYSYLLLSGTLGAERMSLHLHASITCCLTLGYANLYVLAVALQCQKIKKTTMMMMTICGIFSFTLSMSSIYHFYLLLATDWNKLELSSLDFMTLLWLFVEAASCTELFGVSCQSWDHNTALCFSSRFQKAARALQSIILVHKQSLMFMTGVVTCLWQHYVCFTRPLSSQVLWPLHSEAERGLLAVRPWGSGMFNQLLEHIHNKKKERCLAVKSVGVTRIAIKPSH